MKTCSTAGTRLESNPHAQLGGEGNPYRGTWAEEVSQAAGGDLQLLEAGDGPQLARCTDGKSRQMVVALPDAMSLGRSGSSADTGHVVCAGIVAIEEVEELGEWRDLPAVTEFEGTADAQVRLDVGRAAEFVEASSALRSPKCGRCWSALVMVNGRAALGLRRCVVNSNPPRNVQCSGQHETVTNVFARKARSLPGRKHCADRRPRSRSRTVRRARIPRFVPWRVCSSR